MFNSFSITLLNGNWISLYGLYLSLFIYFLNMNKESKEWLKRKLEEYNRDNEQTLFDMVCNQNETIKQFLDNPDSKAALGVLKSCQEHIELFLDHMYKYEK